MTMNPRQIAPRGRPQPGARKGGHKGRPYDRPAEGIAGVGSMRLRGRLFLVFLEAAFADHLGDIAVGGAEFQRVRLGLRYNRAAMLLDGLSEGLAVGDLDAPVMDAGSGTRKLGLLLVLAVVDHQREVDIAVGHVPRRVAARMSGLGLIDPEHVLIELCRLLQVVHVAAFDGDVYDA